MTHNTHQSIEGWTAVDRAFLIGTVISALATVLGFLVVLNSGPNPDAAAEPGLWGGVAFMTMLAAGSSTICLPAFWFDYRWRRKQRMNTTRVAGESLSWKCSPEVWRAFMEIERQDGRQAFSGIPVLVGILLLCGIGCFVFSWGAVEERTHYALWICLTLAVIGMLGASIHFIMQTLRVHWLSSAEPVVVLSKTGFQVGNSLQTWDHLTEIEMKRDTIPYIELRFRVFNGNAMVDVERRIPVMESHRSEAAAFVAGMQDTC